MVLAARPAAAGGAAQQRAGYIGAGAGTYMARGGVSCRDGHGAAQVSDVTVAFEVWGLGFILYSTLLSD